MKPPANSSSHIHDLAISVAIKNSQKNLSSENSNQTLDSQHSLFFLGRALYRYSLLHQKEKKDDE